MTEIVKERPMPTGEGLTFEKVWAMFQETDRKFQESKLESEREWREIRAESREATRLMKENAEWLKKYEVIVNDSNKKNGELSNSFGELVEHLVRPGIEEKLNELGYHFSEVSPRGHEVKDANMKTIAEVDILLENTETIMAVEVKSKPNHKDIQEHIKRLKILRETRDEKKDKRKIEGAIAGAIFKDEVKKAAQKAGFYVIVQSGDTMKIDMPEGWKPKAW
jgi:hypothetical protein